jgi:F-type H+-transporting ATPase subunit b
MTRPHRALVALALAALWAAPVHAAEGSLDIMPDLPRLVVLIVFFVVLVPILDRLVFRPLVGVLEERERLIDGSRSRAAELATQASELLARHDLTVREVRESANADRLRQIDEARRAQQGTVAGARSEAEQSVAATRSDVARALEDARAALRAEAEPLAREMAERLIGRRLA